MSYLILEDKVNSSVIWQILNTIGTKYSRVDQVKICGRQPLKKLRGYGLLKLTIFFKGCLPQILLGPILNTWSQMKTGYKSLTKESSIHPVSFLRQGFLLCLARISCASSWLLWAIGIFQLVYTQKFSKD